MTIRRLCLCLAALAAAAVMPAAAHADSLVYLKGGKVWVANPDNSSARAFTLHDYGWSSPSMADDGTVVAAGGLSRVNPDGSDSDGSSELYRFAPDGNQVGTFTPTYGSYSTPACPAYPPSSVRVSPDASKIAYGIYGCGAGGYQTALWTPAGSTGLNFPDQSAGQTDFWQPVWINNSRFAISHAGPPVFGAQFGEHLVTDGDNEGAGWAEDAPVADRTAEAVISRDGKEAAVVYHDAADWSDGKPRNADLWVYSNPAMPADFSAAWPTPPDTCRFHLDAAKLGDIDHLSPTLSPDGRKFLFGDADGVKVMSLGDPTAACAGAGSPVLIVPGGSQPFYAKGNVQPAAANPRQPDPTAAPPVGNGGGGSTGGGGAAGGSGGTTGGTGQSTTTTTTSVFHLLARFSFRPKKPKRRAKVTFNAGTSSVSSGRIVSYSWRFGDKKKGKGRKVKHAYKKPGRYTVTLTVRDAAGHKATVRHKVKITR